MTREQYEALSVTVLKDLAKSRGLRNISALKKKDVIERMLAEDEKLETQKNTGISGQDNGVSEHGNIENRITEGKPMGSRGVESRGIDNRNQENRRADAKNPEERSAPDLSNLDSGIQAEGILEVMPDGYGFIRCANYLPGENDVYVSPSQIRRFGLKTGDILKGNTRIKTQQEKFSALLYLKTINGRSPAEASKRYNFEDMTPIFPNERLMMEREGRGIAMRIVDMVSPIGKGQRGMIVSPPKAGKTTLLKDVAKSILQNDKNMHLIILLIDERPEEVTDIREAITGDNVEVIYSTFDELPEHHKRVSEMVIERAKRLVEHNEDVTILLDSITRLARAYNLTIPPSGRAAALLSWQRRWWTPEARWMMLYMRSLKEPETWNWFWTENFQRDVCSRRLIFRNPARGGRICC